MSFYSDNFRSYVQKVLQLPVLERISELNLLLERCSYRELQEIFPSLVYSVFGFGAEGNGLGWGLRTTTRQNAPYCFNILYEFFYSNGPFFRVLYRLLNDAIKFEFALEILPHKVTEMLQTGQHPMFYADLINIDPFRRKVSNLLLNSFDFFMLHFAVHATLPLHEIHPAALQIHTEFMPTVFFQLSINYFANFLPSSPDGVVYPADINPLVKAPPTIQLQPAEPKKTLKYLKIPNSPGMFSTPNNTSCGSPPQTGAERMMETARGSLWRTESVLFFFVDTWLCYDIEDARNLPSSEFIRLVRVLVKSVHAFANSAFYDNSFMLDLRKLAHPLMKSRFYPFVRSLIGRWPLDSSMFVVLELWLSYIQPWRYTQEFLQPQTPVVANERQRLELMSNRFDGFIVDNLAIYTQIFVQLLARFARLDFGSQRNADMLLRLVKTFNQSCLTNKLYEAECLLAKTAFCYDATPQKTAAPTYLAGPTHKPHEPSNEWPCATAYGWDGYVPMFGPEIRGEVELLIRIICNAHRQVKQEIVQLRHRKVCGGHRYVNFIRDMYAQLFQNLSAEEIKLRQLLAIPQMLEWCMQTLSQMFNVEMPDYTWEERESQPDLNFSQYSHSFRDGKYEDFDISKVSPTMMQNNLTHLNYTMDPALMPIESHESKVLVRALHLLSTQLNEKYGSKFNDWWQQPTLYGKIARQLLSPPMTTMWFDKPRGVNELCENPLPPRLCLRPLASYRVLLLIGVSLLVGKCLWSSPLMGLFAFIFLFFVYITVLAILS